MAAQRRYRYRLKKYFLSTIFPTFLPRFLRAFYTAYPRTLFACKYAARACSYCELTQPDCPAAQGKA